ncbi:MAG: aminotransferase class I/II-fold pyridoxal phosphate-dependent enzyme, partial [Lachnospiraceae bacterium]|nr:aminotransferase class I/II-fold pyridoxal phosphate-dependent enzyme [Lachnospiraceae bacterium]
MISQEYKEMLGAKSVIRQMSEWAAGRAKEIGSENVFDFSLGNPSVAVPKEFTDKMIALLQECDTMELHGYSQSQGIPSVRAKFAAFLNQTFGMEYTAEHLFMTTGAAGAVAHAVRAVTQPGDEVITFAPYFPEYNHYVGKTGAVLKVVPADTEQFQINFAEFEKLLNPKTMAVLINT